MLLKVIFIFLILSIVPEDLLHSDSDGSSSSLIKSVDGQPTNNSNMTSRLIKPNGMSDQQYAKLLQQIDGKGLTDSEQNEWWQSVVNWWKKFVERVRSAARRVEDFFDNLFGNRSGPGTPGFPTPPPGAPGADGPPSPDDMVNRRNVDRGVPRSGDHVPSWMNPSSTGKPNINTETNEVVVTDQKKPKVWTVQDSR